LVARLRPNQLKELTALPQTSYLDLRVGAGTQEGGKTGGDRQLKEGDRRRKEGAGREKG